MRKIIFLLVLTILISGCGSSYYLRKADNIDQQYNEGKITYEQRQKMYNSLIKQLRRQQIFAAALQGAAAGLASYNPPTYSQPYNAPVYSQVIPKPVQTQQINVVSPNRGVYLGKYSSNKYDSHSISNPYGQYGSKYSSSSINNQYGQYGSKYSSTSVNNPYAHDVPKLYSQDGRYLGKISSNRYDSESISNPYGRYGSRYSSDSINNPYGQYGSPYSSQSVNNPYATNTPIIYYDKDKG